MFACLFVVMLGLCFCSKGNSQSTLGRPSLFIPSEALVDSFVDFYCEIEFPPENETVLFQVFNKDNHDRLLGEYTSLNREVAIIPQIIQLHHEGNLECVAKAQNNSNVEPTVSDTQYLKVIEPVRGAEVVVPQSQVDFFEGETLQLNCELTAGNHVSYKWLLNGQLVSPSPLHHVADKNLLIDRATSKDTGYYMCVATNHFNKTNIFTSNSSEVMITFKERVSIPDISFTVLKEDSHNISAMVTCRATEGTPPVTFSVYNTTELVANVTVEERNATFKVPLVLGRDLGWLHCQASNGAQIQNSPRILLKVVPVGGPVRIRYDYDVENYAVIGLRFYCRAAKGSLPQYRWFLNKTLLHDRGSFYHVVNQPPEQSILLLSAGRSSAGTYHCDVSDSFDSSSSISSNKLYLDKEVLNRLPVLVVAVVFGCFTFLVVLVSICCLAGVIFKQRQYGRNSLLSLEMKGLAAAYEDELDLSEYNKDAVFVEFDQASGASSDEWPRIEEEKASQDEPAEGP
uniref:Si:dkey-93h22.7 n=1 Tax=Gasterosteus aculeatus aculeatus TaxID=481459 RepID=G3Q5P4_GASAC|nr:contactin-5 isoform X1 [Gasterosteus aculeatus aculeatus]